MSEENWKYLKVYYPKMKCIDIDLFVFGDYTSHAANNLNIVFEKCDSVVRTCKSNEEIENWLKRKFMITVSNTNVFRMSVFNDTKITFEAQFKWYPVFASD